MTLTEQWKKGELKDGWYYVINNAHSIKFNQLAYYSELGDSKFWYGCKDADIEEVLAPVPSYEEYSRLEWYAGCGPDRIVELSKENRQLRKWCEEFNALDVAKENQQLKELLKECREYIKTEQKMLVKCNPFHKNLMNELITKIDNAIGEKR